VAIIGYARVSTNDQDLALQLDALESAGAIRVFSDAGSGALVDRPQLTACLGYLRDGDTLAVWRLDRLGRSLRHLVTLIDELSSRGVQFRSLTEAIDTSTPGGRLQLGIFAALAEFERELISERTRAGIAAARRRGREPGRRRVMTASKIRAAKALKAEGMRMTQIAAELSVSRSALYAALGAQTRHSATAIGPRKTKGTAI
jgi:DNA invertase Pin-like site-specific DNA recombinase